MNEFEGCPYCGKDPATHKDSEGFWVECLNLDCEAVVMLNAETREKALEIWNKRHESEQHQRELRSAYERLEAAEAEREHLETVSQKQAQAFGKMEAQLAKQTLPDGIEWPCFEDGKPVGFDDVYQHESGIACAVYAIAFNNNPDGCKAYHINYGEDRPMGEPLKRPEPDTPERIIEDAKQPDPDWSNLLERIEKLAKGGR